MNDNLKGVGGGYASVTRVMGVHQKSLGNG